MAGRLITNEFPNNRCSVVCVRDLDILTDYTLDILTQNEDFTVTDRHLVFNDILFMSYIIKA